MIKKVNLKDFYFFGDFLKYKIKIQYVKVRYFLENNINWECNLQKIYCRIKHKFCEKSRNYT